MRAPATKLVPSEAPSVVVMVPQMGENKGKIGVLRGNQGRSAGATTREGGGMPVGNAGDVPRPVVGAGICG